MPRAVKGIFIAGTDTGVGKTLVTGLLARYWLEKGTKVVTQKWVQTGSSVPCDLLRHQALMRAAPAGRDAESFTAAGGYCFTRAASPHLAARLSNKKISSRLIRQRFNALAASFDLVIVEAAGGVLVPYDRRHLLLDIAARLGLAVIVVAANKLGAINHTLLAIEALRSRRMRIVGVIFNRCGRTDAAVARDNPAIVARLGKVRILGDLPYAKRPELIYAKCKPVARAIERALCRTI